MKNKIKFSFIIPIYNVKEYLQKCVESVLGQEYSKDMIEIILVDDGSTDGSSRICDEIAKESSFIKVIHKKNGGLSDARNVGLLQATGDYVFFLDSDDYVELNSCAEFEKRILSCDKLPDIIAGVTCKWIGDDKKIIFRNNVSEQLISGKEYLKKELYGQLFVTAWSSIYNIDFLKKNSLQFKVGYIHEDEDFTPRAFLRAKNVLSTNIIFYNYIIRDGSITTTANKIRNAKCIFDISKDLLDIYDQLDDNELKTLLLTHTAKICYRAIVDARLDKKEYRNIVDDKILNISSIKKYERFRYRLWKCSPKLYYFFSKIK